MSDTAPRTATNGHLLNYQFRRADAAETIAKFLTSQVRVASKSQLLGLLEDAGGSSTNTQSVLQHLERHDLVSLHSCLVHPILPLAGPVWTWRPAEAPPNAERIAWQLRSRWTLPPVRTLTVTATKRAHYVWGGRRIYRLSRPSELCHDLHVSQLYFQVVQNSLKAAEHWIHEDALRGAGTAVSIETIPDALLGQTALDFGGSYGAAKIRRIHASYAAHGIPYEIW